MMKRYRFRLVSTQHKRDYPLVHAESLTLYCCVVYDLRRNTGY